MFEFENGVTPLNDTNLNKMQKELIEDNLNSESVLTALSANQGRILNEIIQTIEGIVVYESTDGTNGNITLTQSATNAKFAEIFYKDNVNIYGSVKVENPNLKEVVLSLGVTNSNTNGFWTKTSHVKFSDTNLSVLYYVEGDVIAGTVTKVNRIYITKVILYF